MRILIVEDDALQSSRLAQTLDDHFGRGTSTAIPSALDVLTLPATELAAFDAILTEFNLRDMPGLDFLREILRRVDRPVIVVTSENVRQTALQAIRAGAADYVLNSGDYLFAIPLVVEKNLEAWRVRQENKRLHEQQQAAAREISLKNQQLKDSLQKLEQMAATDPLTGVYNRRHFSEVLEKYFAESARYSQDLACIMCDLDGYKKLNDTLGHQFGDKILQVTASIIARNLRVMDIPARYGGDEFVLLLPHAGAHEALAVGERIREQFISTMKGMIPATPENLTLTLSMGIASVHQNLAGHSDQLVALADEALYEAKHAGKNRTLISDKIKGVIQLTPTAT